MGDARDISPVADGKSEVMHVVQRIGHWRQVFHHVADGKRPPVALIFLDDLSQTTTLDAVRNNDRPPMACH